MTHKQLSGHVLAGFSLALAAACGGDRGDDLDFAPGVSGDPADDGTDGGDADDDGGDGGDRLDVGNGDGDADPDGHPEGCEKVDFLFVVDNSASMVSTQENLATSFPGFMDAMKTEVTGQDYHVMVVDSDADPTWVCEPSVHDGDPAWPDLWEYSECPPLDDPPLVCVGYPCGASGNLESEDKTVGCGVVRPYGGNASNADCAFVAGRRYLANADSEFEDKFLCASRVGSSGHSLEQPISSMLAAISEPFNSGGCNDGFLRDDAILVVVLISDDMDEITDGPDEVMEGVGGTVTEWYDAVVAAKGGDETAIVMLGLLATEEGGDVAEYCGHGSDPIFGVAAAEKFIEFVGLFGDRGLIADTCEPDYTPFFSEAVGLIDQACDEFTPPG
jgi:hypothetical protein